MNLKKSILVILGFIGFLISCSDANNEKITGNFTTIKGTYKLTFPYDNVKEVKLSKIVRGEKQEIATYKLKGDKKYGFTFPNQENEEGFYVLTSPYHSIPIYVKKNQVFNIDIHGKEYTQSNIPDAENKTLYNWVRSNDTLAHYRVFSSKKPATYKDFFPFYKEYAPKMKEFHNQVNTPNIKFNSLMHAYIDLSIEKEVRHFLMTPREEHPTVEIIKKTGILEPYADGHNFKTTTVLELPNGMSTLSMRRANDLIYAQPQPKGRLSLSKMTVGIANDTIKAFFILSKIRDFKGPVQLKEYIKEFKDIIAIDNDVQNGVNDYLSEINIFDVGTPGFDFVFKDQNDKEVSFSSLKGKVVYIDMWAMWCAPCKAEIPALKQLEKGFHGKDIEFVSISLDKPKEQEKWKKFVADKKLGGIQLFADNAFKSEIATNYKINSIPRFMLFDKEGNILNSHATRPSDPKTKEILNNLLK
ncbi:MAG: TlpA disulfide reductase family protein [Flavobacteriaceae bacterium]